MPKTKMWFVAAALALSPVVAAAQTETEVREEIVDRANEDTDAVLRGETSLPQATRDPVKTLDLGASVIVPFLFVVFGSVVKPFIMRFVEKRPDIDNRMAGAINGLALIMFFLGMWALLHTSYSDLPQDPLSFVLLGFGAAGLGDTITSVGRTVKGKLNANRD